MNTHRRNQGLRFVFIAVLLIILGSTRPLHHATADSSQISQANVEIDKCYNSIGHSFIASESSQDAPYTDPEQKKLTCVRCGMMIIIPSSRDTLDIAALEEHGMGYAAWRGFILTYDLGLNGEICGYYPPSTYTFTTMAAAYIRAEEAVDYLYKTFTNMGEDITLFRINVKATNNGDGTYTLTAYYG